LTRVATYRPGASHSFHIRRGVVDKIGLASSCDRSANALPTTYKGVADHLGKNRVRSGRDRLRLFLVSGKVQVPVVRTSQKWV
jgi:hypothetical protein